MRDIRVLSSTLWTHGLWDVAVRMYSLIFKLSITLMCKYCCFIFSSGKIDEQEWRFLLTGGVALENKFPNPASGWLTDKSWAEIVRCSGLPSFQGILNHFTEHVSFCFVPNLAVSNDKFSLLVN